MVSNLLIGQGQANIWYFGEYLGLDFNGGSPVALTNSSMFGYEGVSTVSDNQGNLIFYTDGNSVWNRNHSIMPNGSGLLGGSSMSQSVISIPKPGVSNIYYVFTTNPSYGIHYSEIDMNLSSGLGDININKNILINQSTTEKLTAIRHQNGMDFWLLTHEYYTDTFNVYFVSSSGVSITPVISEVGSQVTWSEVGYMKGSPNGTMVASCNYDLNEVQLFDFNNSTGVLSNPTTLNGLVNFGPYGVEFSPDGNILYVSTDGPPSNVYQYDLNAGSINASRITIGSQYMTGALQIGPDYKIYCSKWWASELARIDNPNILGVGCNFDSSAVNLGGGQSWGGLPNYPNWFLTSVEPTIDFMAISIYPNPTSSYFTIEGLKKPHNLTIYNSLGQLLYSKNNISDSSKKIDASQFKSGLLFIRIELEGEVYRFKLLKQ